MSSKRKQFRVPYGKELIIRMDDGYLIAGVAGDINDGGFFLKPHGKEDLSKRLGQGGTLIMDLQIETLELPCKVVRIAPHGMGIQFV